MGDVYEAQQEDVPRRVALKMLNAREPDEHRVRLFLREIDTLSRLDHPGIARIYEAGRAPDGRHFFTMALIDGKPLDVYLDRAKSSRRECLNLFTRICEAVGYAHKKNVIHRDLKPANILVDAEGDPKVIDFSIALMAAPHLEQTEAPTDGAGIIGTPAYMSPEQAAGVVDHFDERSDTYALGVILFELLTGEPPYDLRNMSRAEALNAIRTKAPQAPTAIDPTLRGDLEFILLKALAKDPFERYRSATDLADAIECYLANRPIPGRTTTPADHFLKLVARHKLPSALVALLFVSVLIFGICMAVMYRDAASARNRAQCVLQLLLDRIVSPNPYWNEPLDAGVRDHLDGVARWMEDERVGPPEVEATLRDALGLAYTKAGMYQQAEDQLSRALDIRLELFGDEHLEVASSMEHLYFFLPYLRWCANRHSDADEYREAAVGLRRALDIRRKLLGQDHNETIWTISELTHLYRLAGDFPAAGELTVEGLLRATRAVLGPEVVRSQASLVLTVVGAVGTDEDRARAQEYQALLEGFLADSGESLSPEKARQAVDWAMLFIREQWLAGNHEAVRNMIRLCYEPLMSDPYWNYQVPLVLIGFGERQLLCEDYDAAEPILREALVVTERRFGPTHLFKARCLENLARVLQAKGNRTESEQLIWECLKTRLDLLGEEHPHVAGTRELLGLLLMEQANPRAAEPELRKCLSSRRRVEGNDHWLTAYTERLLGQCLTTLGQYGEAETLLLDSYSVMKQRRGEQDEQTQEVLNQLVHLYEASGETEKAAEYRTLLWEAGGSPPP